MNLTGLVAVSGKPGLFKIIGQNKGGFILQALNEAETKIAISNHSKVATLNDTTVYGEEEDLTLKQIFKAMQAQLPTLPLPDVKAENDALRTYFVSVAPAHDRERVYASDIKKIVGWFRVIQTLPVFDEEDPSEKTDLPEKAVEEQDFSMKQAAEGEEKEPRVTKQASRKKTPPATEGVEAADIPKRKSTKPKSEPGTISVPKEKPGAIDIG